MSRYLHVLSVLLALTAVSYAVPKPQDWKNMDWNNMGIDWNAVDYGNGNGNAGGAPAVPEGPKTTHVQGQPMTTTVYDQAPTTLTTTSSTSSTPPAVASPDPKPVSNPGSGSGSGSSGTPSGGKRGVSYNYESPSLDMLKDASSISWGWDWAGDRISLPEDKEFVPCLRTAADDVVKEFNDHYKVGSAKYLMSFNEADHGDQANLAVDDCVTKHISLMKDHVDAGTLIGSPSVTSDTAPGKGLEYLGSFLEKCSQQAPPCKIDFCNVHWYSSFEVADTVDNDVSNFKEHMGNAIKTCNGLPVWLTEFKRVLGSDAEKQSFMEQAVDFLEQSAVERYSYFMIKDGEMTSGGSLNGLGNAYVSA